MGGKTRDCTEFLIMIQLESVIMSVCISTLMTTPISVTKLFKITRKKMKVEKNHETLHQIFKKFTLMSFVA